MLKKTAVTLLFLCAVFVLSATALASGEVVSKEVAEVKNPIKFTSSIDHTERIAFMEEAYESVMSNVGTLIKMNKMQVELDDLIMGEPFNYVGKNDSIFPIYNGDDILMLIYVMMGSEGRLVPAGVPDNEFTDSVNKFDRTREYTLFYDEEGVLRAESEGEQFYVRSAIGGYFEEYEPSEFYKNKQKEIEEEGAIRQYQIDMGIMDYTTPLIGYMMINTYLIPN